MPVMMPRQSDSDMYRDGYKLLASGPQMPTMSTEECTAYQTSNADSCPLLGGDP